MTDHVRRWLAEARAQLPERDGGQDPQHQPRRRVGLRKVLAEKAKRKDRKAQ